MAVALFLAGYVDMLIPSYFTAIASAQELLLLLLLLLLRGINSRSNN